MKLNSLVRQQLTRLWALPLYSLATLFSASTVVLGAPFYRLLYRQYGRVWYWGLTLVLATVSGIFPPLALYLWLALAVSVLIGIYSEFESIQYGPEVAGFLSIVVVVGLVCAVATGWLHLQQLSVTAFVHQYIEPRVAQINQLSQTPVEASEVINQLPSGFVILLMVTLLMAFMADARVRLPGEKLRTTAKASLAKFSVPSFCVWIVMAALLGSFYKHDWELVRTISLNTLNVMLVLYFLQGAAVMRCYFKYYRIGSVWQALIIGLIAIKLFLFMSVLGYSDYWFNFRQHLSRRTPEGNRTVLR